MSTHTLHALIWLAQIDEFVRDGRYADPLGRRRELLQCRHYAGLRLKAGPSIRGRMIGPPIG